MSTAKTEVAPENIEGFITSHGYTGATFEPVEGGELSQAYFFSTANGDMVLRINTTDEGFLKDKYAAEHFASDTLPIPPVRNIGQLAEDKYFAVSDRAHGKVLESFSLDAIRALMPQIIAVVDAIHATPPNGEGYGWLRLDGSGHASSWHQALDQMQSTDDEKLAKVEFFEKEYYDHVRAEAEAYYQYCPDIRQLIHGDLSGNTLSDGARITGVIDWHSAMYGDPLWDIAWLDFWAGTRGYAEAFRQHYAQQNRLPDNFNERLTCYKLIIGANSLAFFAKSGQPEKYDYTKDILTGLKI
jgi:hygromycin-B 4-O-kinase